MPPAGLERRFEPVVASGKLEGNEERQREELELVLARAHAPYSRFRVAARMISRDGFFVDGCNVENASFGLSLCAERVAAFRALSRGMRAFRTLLIVSSGSDPVTPCGACRELLLRLAPDLEVVMFGAGETLRARVSHLLPS